MEAQDQVLADLTSPKPSCLAFRRPPPALYSHGLPSGTPRDHWPFSSYKVISTWAEHSIHTIYITLTSLNALFTKITTLEEYLA